MCREPPNRVTMRHDDRGKFNGHRLGDGRDAGKLRERCGVHHHLSVRQCRKRKQAAKKEK
jgi:hypothetical protein